MSSKVKDVTKEEASVDLRKREFMGKVGKYAAVGAGMATLMTPTLSTAGNYGTDCYRGTPDQNSIHTDTVNHGRSNHRDRNGHKNHRDRNGHI